MWSLQTTCNVSQTTLFSPKKGIEEQTQLKRTVTFTRCSRRTSPREREVRSAFAATYSPGVPFLAWLKRVYAAEQGQVQFLYLASWTGCIFSTSQAVKRERRLAISLLQDCGINIFFFKKLNSVILVWEIARSVCQTTRIRLIKKVFWLKTGSGFADASAAHFFQYFLERLPVSYSHQSD